MVVLHRDEGGLQAFDQSNLAPFSNSPCNGAVMFSKPLKTCGTTTTAPINCRRILSAAPLSPGNEIENSQRKFPVYTRTLSPRRLQSAPTIGHRNRPSPGPAWPTLRSASLHQYGTEQRLLVSPRLHGQPRSASSCVPTKSPRSITWSVTPAA
ncbi:hypothetical protein T06_3613 [Trichinella sp. T6]|nr:hypothetical protein T06_3613 [Trichinella sp. T6]